MSNKIEEGKKYTLANGMTTAFKKSEDAYYISKRWIFISEEKLTGKTTLYFKEDGTCPGLPSFDVVFPKEPEVVEEEEVVFFKEKTINRFIPGVYGLVEIISDDSVGINFRLLNPEDLISENDDEYNAISNVDIRLTAKVLSAIADEQEKRD